MFVYGLYSSQRVIPPKCANVWIQGINSNPFSEAKRSNSFNSVLNTCRANNRNTLLFPLQTYPRYIIVHPCSPFRRATQKSLLCFLCIYGIPRTIEHYAEWFYAIHSCLPVFYFVLSYHIRLHLVAQVFTWLTKKENTSTTQKSAYSTQAEIRFFTHWNFYLIHPSTPENIINDINYISLIPVKHKKIHFCYPWILSPVIGSNT